MGFLKRLVKGLLRALEEGAKEEKKRSRYKPGDFDRVLGKDMNQVKDQFRQAFSNHYENEDD